MKSELQKAKTDTALTKSYYGLAMDYYFPLARTDSLKRISKEISALNQKTNWPNGLYLEHLLNGAIAKLNGNFYEATQLYFQALRIAEQRKDNAQLARCNYELGNCYSLLEQLRVSTIHYQRAIKLSKLVNNQELLGWCCNNIAQDYAAQKKFTPALEYYREALSVFEKIDLLTGKANVLENLGTLFYLQSNYPKAEEYLLRSNKMFIQLNRSKYMIANNYVRLAETNLALNKTIKSIQYANKSIEIASENTYSELLMQAHDILYLSYKKLSRNAEALTHFEKKIYYQNLKNQDEKTRMINALKLDYENKKHLEINQLQKKELTLEKKVNFILKAGVITFIIFVLALLIVINKIKKQNRLIVFQRDEIKDLNVSLEKKVLERTHELSIANQELIKKNAEIEDAIFNGQKIERKRFASELHDNLGATLTSVKWRLEAINKHNLPPKEQRNYESIVESLKNVYSDVRFISHNLLPTELEREGLIGALSKLVSDINNSGKILIHIQNDGIELDKKVAFEVYNILMEILGNILKHADATFVKISLIKMNERFKVTVKDNGRGFDIDHTSNGVGIQNIKERAKSISADITFISKTDKGTEIIMIV
ncbi:ATP-binding protein [Runella rosea]|uniref:ATP-binding protein n=1 Tax=Runella rosea TaxID=2259595 RepID=UPI0013B402F0|nr:tetratricopeptide repeat protein [Runella rosea]